MISCSLKTVNVKNYFQVRVRKIIKGKKIFWNFFLKPKINMLPAIRRFFLRIFIFLKNLEVFSYIFPNCYLSKEFNWQQDEIVAILTFSQKNWKFIKSISETSELTPEGEKLPKTVKSFIKTIPSCW